MKGLFIFRRTFLSVAVMATVVGATPSFAPAQAVDPKREKKAQEIKQKIQKLGTGQSAVVKVKLYNDTEYKGYVSRAGEDDFEVVDTARTPHAVRYSDVRSIGGRNMSTGAKIAIGIGIGAGVALLVLVLIFNEITEDN